MRPPSTNTSGLPAARAGRPAAPGGHVLRPAGLVAPITPGPPLAPRAPTLASARPADRADGARSRLGYVAPMNRSLALLSATDDDLPETEMLRLGPPEGGG